MDIATILIIVFVIILLTVFIIFGRYYLSDITQTKPIKLTHIEPDALNFMDKLKINNPQVPKQYFKANVKFSNNRAKAIKLIVMNKLNKKFDEIRELIKKETDSNKQVELFRNYEIECLNLWKQNRVDIDPMTNDQIELEIATIVKKKQLNYSVSKLTISQSIFDFNCTVPLGWFYHWDLVDENIADTAIKTGTFINNVGMVSKIGESFKGLFQN